MKALSRRVRRETEKQLRAPLARSVAAVAALCLCNLRSNFARLWRAQSRQSPLFAYATREATSRAFGARGRGSRRSLLMQLEKQPRAPLARSVAAVAATKEKEPCILWRINSPRIQGSFSLLLLVAYAKAGDGNRTRDLLTTNEVRYRLCHASI